MANWLDKYEQGGLVLKKKTKDNYDLKANPNDVQASVGPGFVGAGYDTTGRNYSPAWGGQFQYGGFLQPNSYKLPSGIAIPNRPDILSSELATSIGGEDGEPAYLIPSFKGGKRVNALEEYKKTGEHLGGPFKTWQEADKWEQEVRHPYVEKGQSLPSPLKWWGDMQEGGNLPEVTVYGHRNPTAKAYFDRWRKEAESWQDREEPVNTPMAAYLAGEQMYTKYKGHDIKMIDPNDRPMLWVTPFSDTLNIPNPENDYYGNKLVSELSHKVQLNKKGNLGFIGSHTGNDYLNTLKNISLSDVFNADKWKSAYDSNYYTPGTQEYEAHHDIEPKLKEEFQKILDKEYEKLTPSKKMQVGGSMPGAVGFMYARTAGSAPDNGKYAKKTKSSAQNGKSVYKADPKDKKLYGAKDEESIKNWFNDYYNSDFFKSNLNSSNNAFGMKDNANELSKEALKNLADTEIRYKGEVNGTRQRTYGDYNHIFMGDPNLYYNQPTSEVFAHEAAHIDQGDILANQPRNVFFMLNKNKLTNRKNEANTLANDMLAPVPRNIDDSPKFPSQGEFAKHTLGSFISDEIADSQSGSHDSTVPEIRADIMALRELSAKKGIWDAVKNKPGSFTPEMLNKLYQTKELNVPMQYTDKQGSKTIVHPSDESLKQGDLKNVNAPKNPGLILERLRRRYSDNDLLFLMNRVAKNENMAPIDQAQNGKEMSFYQNGLDFKPKSIAQNGVKKGKKSSPEVSPYAPIDASNANTIRNRIPAPLNVSQAIAKVFGGDSRLNETSLDDDQKVALWNTIQNARKRSGVQSGGGTEYVDYGGQGHGTGQDFDNWFNRGKVGALSGMYNSLTNPGFVMASTVGRGRYWADPNNPDDINYTDVYDWNTHEKNYKGINPYQIVRNLVRGSEDKNLNKSKNDQNRMNIHLTKKEIDDINERKEMKLSSLIAFDKGGVIKDDRGQWAHPGEITEIGSNNITMQGVDYPVLGISDTGDTKLMQPGEDYKFDGKKVTEYPMAQGGKKVKPTVKEIMQMPMPVEERYEPSDAVKNTKAVLSGIDLATLPAIETPWGFVANRAAGIANSVGDAYTAARYAMDGQWGNAGIDASEAILDLIPFAKGKKTYNLSKGATNLPFVYNKLSKVDKAANKALRIGKGMSYADDFKDVVPTPKKETGGWLNKYE